MQDALKESGDGARKNWLEAKSQQLRAEGEVQNLQDKIATAKNALLEAESSVTEAAAKARQKLSEERVKAASDLAETEQQLVKLADRFDRLIIRAPSDGVVQELVPKSLGEVVRPGDPVARIVPTNRELVAEVRIDPKDLAIFMWARTPTSGSRLMTAQSSVKFAARSSTCQPRHFPLPRDSQYRRVRIPPSLITKQRFAFCRIMLAPVLRAIRLRREWFCRRISKPVPSRSFVICSNRSSAH